MKTFEFEGRLLVEFPQKIELPVQKYAFGQELKLWKGTGIVGGLVLRPEIETEWVEEGENVEGKGHMSPLEWRYIIYLHSGSGYWEEYGEVRETELARYND